MPIYCYTNVNLTNILTSFKTASLNFKTNLVNVKNIINNVSKEPLFYVKA